MLLPSAARPSNELTRGGPMKRILISAIAIALLIAGCGSGGSTTPAATKAKTTKSTTTTKTTTTHKKKRRVVKKRRTVVHKSTTRSSGGAAVTTTTAATTAVTTTSSAPPPPTTTTHSAPPPVTTHQQPPPKKHHNGGGGGSHGGGYCLSVTDRIGTPTGSVPVAQIKPGMHVWSTDRRGRRISVKVLRVHHTAVPSTHLMVRLHLADGRTVLASLGHPLPSGQAIKTLAVGQRFEGTRVVSDARVRYGRPYTYDLLPAGPTHTYYADGVLLGSTLAPLDFTNLF